jgi:hypothetical protein
MSHKKFSKLVNRKTIIGLAVPIAVCAASLFFNLRPVFQQAMVGIMMIWFSVGFVYGFGVWQ